MTLNDSWGFSARTINWKTSKTIISANLISCARDGGKLSLEHGPQGRTDRFQEESVKVSSPRSALDADERSFHLSKSDLCQVRRSPKKLNF